MIHLVPVEQRSLDAYEPIVGATVVEEIRSLAAPLRGARVLHLSATAYGGGVAEILQSLVPLMNDVGLHVEWRVIYGADQFFDVTKGLHNGLQGKPCTLTPEGRRVYLETTKLNAQAFEGSYDFVIVHDPQPAGILSYLDAGVARHWIWRCHIDTSHPNEEVVDFMRPLLEPFEVAVYTLPDYLLPTLHFPRVAFVTPTIDPLSPKNQPLSLEDARRIVSRFGIDPARPLVTQVSRFDPWKDPLGVIDAYRMIKVEMPDLQLAMVGSMANDDPEGQLYYERTIRRAGEDYDIFLLHNIHGVGSREVNAFQVASDVVIQKSTREGFGLVVTEALWKQRPVVGGNVGGIGLQVIDGETGYLVDNSLSCAERVHHLLRNPELRRTLGEQGRRHVRDNFLLPRLVRDDLRLFTELDASGHGPVAAGSAAGAAEYAGREGER